MRRHNVLANICFLSNTGRVRQNNEDSLLVNETLISETDMEEPECLGWQGERLLCVVADGMGGHQRGELASRTVLNVFRTRYRVVDNREWIRDVMGLAKESLDRIVEADKNSIGLGTTISGLIIMKSSAVVFNCGDSRVYLQRGGSLDRITKDHSLVQELVDAGVIAAEEMRTHPQKNIITSSIMGDLGHYLPVFSVSEFAIKGGDRFFLCTDGVWESMGHIDLEHCLEGGAEEGIRCILHKSFAAGARDNLTMIVAEIREEA
jgi:serine/threonine protein phosphatase PrpC